VVYTPQDLYYELQAVPDNYSKKVSDPRAAVFSPPQPRCVLPLYSPNGTTVQHISLTLSAGHARCASEDEPERFGSPEFVTKIPDEVISNLSIEISVLKAIWLSKNRPDSCPRRPGVGARLADTELNLVITTPQGRHPAQGLGQAGYVQQDPCSPLAILAQSADRLGERPPSAG
jgi:hypothetical protein